MAQRLGINMDDYGKDKSANSFYKEVALVIRGLRTKKVLNDWNTTTDGRGIGIWHLDKSRLDQVVGYRVRKEMREENFYCAGRTATVYVRQKQGAFKQLLEREYGRCAFCGFDILDYTIGAHIIPYRTMREKDPHNAMNPANGLLLCRLCDYAFEYGSIRVKKDYGIEVSDRLRDHREPVVKSWIGHVSPELLLGENMRYRPDPNYLEIKLEIIKSRVTRHGI